MGEFVSQIVCRPYQSPGVDINYTILRFSSPWLLFFFLYACSSEYMFVCVSCFIEPTVMAFIFSVRIRNFFSKSRYTLFYSFHFVKNLSDLLQFLSHPFSTLCVWLRAAKSNVRRCALKCGNFSFFFVSSSFKYLFHRCTRAHCGRTSNESFLHAWRDVTKTKKKRTTTKTRRTNTKERESPLPVNNNYSFNPACCECDSIEMRLFRRTTKIEIESATFKMVSTIGQDFSCTQQQNRQNGLELCACFLLLLFFWFVVQQNFLCMCGAQRHTAAGRLGQRQPCFILI